MTHAQRRALDLLRQARRESPTTDDGVVTSEATYYDREIGVAFIHWRTARALKTWNLIGYGDHDPDSGTEIRLLMGDV